MAQQINLYSPIFLAPQRHFSARAMAQALGVFALALLLLCGWAAWGSHQLRRELDGELARGARERGELAAALAALPASGAALTALTQERARVQADLALRQRTLAELDRGLATPGRSHAALLRLVAQTVPASAWLTELSLADGRIELAGQTRAPEALRAWLERLAADPLTAALPVAALKVERSGEDLWRFSVAGAAPVRADPRADMRAEARP